jgi:hypothetical protein
MGMRGSSGSYGPGADAGTLVLSGGSAFGGLTVAAFGAAAADLVAAFFTTHRTYTH